MKHYSILLIAVFALASSCQRSQFSTTTRQYKNGKVTYINNYHKERSKISNIKSLKNQLKESGNQNITTAVAITEMKYPPNPGITKDDNIPITNSLEFLASTSNKPVIYKTNKNLINSDNLTKYPNSYYIGGTTNDSIADTIKSKTLNKNLMFDPSFAHIIKFKNGNEDTVRIISHTQEGFYYHLLSEPKKTKWIMMTEVDTILTDTTYSFQQKQNTTTKQDRDLTPKEMKSSKRWFAFSVMGIIPIVGIPFAIMGIIMGARNLHKIRKNLASIKGKRIARSTVIIGIITLIWNIIITIVIFSAIAAATVAATSSSISSCSSGMHF